MEFLQKLVRAFARTPRSEIAAPTSSTTDLSRSVPSSSSLAVGATSVALAFSGGLEARTNVSEADDKDSRARAVRKNEEFTGQYIKDAKAGNVYLLYQPVVSTHTGEVAMVEGLVRWNDSRTNTQRSAPEVLHAATATNSLFELTRITIRRGIADLKTMHAAGLPHVCIAINLNPEQLCDKNLVAFVREALASEQLDPHYLTLEVTEDAILHDEELVIAQLRALDELGISLAIDDFGVGYSSLAPLQRLPFDSVKIDKIFLENVPENVRRSHFFKAIVDFSKAIGIEPIAEGVETQAQRTFVREVGCSLLQGYAESAPLPLHAFLEDYAPLRASIA